MAGAHLPEDCSPGFSTSSGLLDTGAGLLQRMRDLSRNSGHCSPDSRSFARSFALAPAVRQAVLITPQICWSQFCTDGKLENSSGPVYNTMGQTFTPFSWS